MNVLGGGTVLLVIDQEVDAFAGHHVGELHAAKAGVEQDHTGAALAGSVDSFQEAPMISDQNGHIGTRTKPAPVPLVSQRVGPVVQIAETKRATLVDQYQPIAVSSGSDHRRRP